MFGALAVSRGGILLSLETELVSIKGKSHANNKDLPHMPRDSLKIPRLPPIVQQALI